MMLQEWRARYAGITLETPDPAYPLVYILTSHRLPGQPLRDLEGLEDYRVTSTMLQAHYRPTVWIAPRVNRDDWTRAEYMAHAVDHEMYYLSLARAIGLGPLAAIVRDIAPLDRLVACVNDLNQIPLAHWDANHGRVCGLVRHELMARSWSGQPLPARSICWSISESVCVLKAVARALALQPVCPNCQQWQRENGDCLNECKRRGFAP